MGQSSPPNSVAGPGRVGSAARPARNPAAPLPALPSADLREGGTVPPDPEEMAGRATAAATVAGLQRQLDRFPPYYNTVRPHRALGRRTPPRPTQPDPKPSRPDPSSPPTTGSATTNRLQRRVTLRHNSRLHHIGLGARLAGTPITLLIDDLHIRIIERHTGT